MVICGCCHTGALTKGGVMGKIVIDEEFKSLLPELDKETYALLEENILQNGCRDSLVIWGDILVDGHNRYEICTKHKIPYNTINKDFGSREEALIWIVSTQISRRNLSPLQLSHYRGLHYRADKTIKGTYERNDPLSNKGHNDPYYSTATRLAEQYHVSPKTIKRDAKVAEAIDAIGAVSPEAKRKVLSGEVPVDKRVLQELSTKTEKEIAAVAERIEDGSYVKEKSETSAQGSAQRPSTANAATLVKDKSVDKLTDGFIAELKQYREKGDESGAKTALRTYIDQLENLYRQLP